MDKYIILERLNTILTPIKHLLDKLEANKVDRSELNELNEVLDSKANRNELDTIKSSVTSIDRNLNSKMNISNPTGMGNFSMNGSTVGSYAFAAGKSNAATGNYAFVEGLSNQATGMASHAEGESTLSSGYCAHSEGNHSVAAGIYSHAEGYNTSAYKRSQHVSGEFNKIDPLYETNSDISKHGEYIHIVGNGTTDARSNAHTLDWNGLGWFAGGLKVGGTGQDDANAKTVATQEYVDEQVNNNVARNYVILNSSTEGSTKQFKLTIDDNGVLSTEELTE